MTIRAMKKKAGLLAPTPLPFWPINPDKRSNSVKGCVGSIEGQSLSGDKGFARVIKTSWRGVHDPDEAWMIKHVNPA